MSSILPTVKASDGYKRVDVDDTPRRARFGWKKFVIMSCMAIGLVWALGPREIRESIVDTIKFPTWGRPTRPPPPNDDETTVTAPEKLYDHEPNHKPTADIPSSVPHSSAEDPDPLKTVYCTHPYKLDAPLVQYALVIDAGATGSRIHIYKFNNCGPSPTYEYEVFKMTGRALSLYMYNLDPLGAAESLDFLLDEAVAVVPKSLQSCTPVAVKATAGFRLLGADKSVKILSAVRHRLEEKYPFPVVEKDGVVIMDRSDAGVYTWITANYLLNTIRADSPANTHSYAVLNLARGLSQIVFEPDFENATHFVDGEHKYELSLGGKKHILYQHSHIGYGFLNARKSVHWLVEFMSTLNKATRPENPDPEEAIPNPCLYKGSSRIVELSSNTPDWRMRRVSMSGKDIGSFEACNRFVELVMAKDAICQTKPCSFNGVYQPPILETFAKGDILLSSYFYDRLAPFFPTSFSEQPAEQLTVNDIALLARNVCEGPAGWSKTPWGSSFVSSSSPSSSKSKLQEELEGHPDWCLDLTFMHALLRLGYEFPAERGVRVEKKIEDTELGWCLGATIAIVSGELTCRV
ncbi:uncharacterized protein FOMMEDRAFT_170727 [Fomitiporia mediterranea MF3/22]|uniref:uncharacterized protein n=1 Tax=Fomitiporia mediterranea (strain MF3/22) TaxID=694068 RepID=UPI0004409964|nr:uncharacterized protein FOMMEDRAFT_170727 [Fomitiporia mediterranea MF3/22]EJC98916.1 hypothetical protein FOMMEDRAFT_170727 [Fomitiporia mediterranea MF3/22]